jgi:hypothetical protein
MRFWLLTLLTFNFAFFISACGLDIEDPTPPLPPVWVQKSLPEEWPERGIDGHETGRVLLEWRTNSNDEYIREYELFGANYSVRSDSLSDFVSLAKITSAMDSTFTYVDEMSRPNTRQLYYLIATDESNNSSKKSDTISYKVLNAISVESMSPNGIYSHLDSSRSLSWSNQYSIPVENYWITILTIDDFFISRDLFFPQNYAGQKETWSIPVGLNLDPGQTYKWRIDMSADYVNEYETSGSESHWATFLFLGD